MFSDQFDEQVIHDRVSRSLLASEIDIKRLLLKPRYTLSDMPYFLSPSLIPYLEQFAQKAHALTTQRFGHTMQLFAPLYLSNECYNSCTYCGFSMEHDYERKTLNDEEIMKEALFLKSRGIQHVLLLTGESPRKVGVDYISHAISLIQSHFSSVGIEVQPLDLQGYNQVMAAGGDSLTLYQETYHHEAYLSYHLKGMKRHYKHRLDAVEAGAQAGFYRINIGVLMGLYDWRFDLLSLAEHLSYMQKNYWQTKYAVSFPRIKGFIGNFSSPYPVDDMALVQAIIAFRLVFPDCGITLSTREPAELRDHLIKLGVTSVSAESSTSPGGYASCEAESQFNISDERSIEEIQEMLLTNGFEPVAKDWEPVL